MTTGSNKILGRLGALALGLLIAALVAEGLYRALRGTELGPTTNPSYVQHDPDLGWGYRPGASGRHQTAEFEVEIRIHANGFRGAPWELEPDDRRRLLLLGDSFAFGWGVEEDQAIGARTAARLPGWQVLNAGVSGYGTGQQRLLLERLLAELRPDAVAVVFCSNDLFESGTPASYGKPKPWYRLDERGALQLAGRPVEEGWLERRSQLYRAWLKHSWERDFARAERDPAAEWALARALFGAMRDELATEAGSSPPLILLSETVELALFAGREPGVEHVDLRATLAVAGEEAHYPLDGHWTPAGHERAALALVDELEQLFPDE